VPAADAGAGEANPGLPLSMGMNWFSQDVEGMRMIGQGGETDGQRTEFVVVPAQRFALVLLTNNDGGGRGAGLARWAGYIRGQRFEWVRDP
jgi:hypothetical protein